MSMKKVFLSSTAKDLKEYRDEVYLAIHGIEEHHCIRMEDFGARDDLAMDFCSSKIAECDLFIGIVGHLYGSSPPGSTLSYTEWEYNSSISHNKPRLMFIAPEDFPLPFHLYESDEKRQKQCSFRERVNKERIRDTFNSPDDLAARVIRAIHNLELRHVEAESSGYERLHNAIISPSAVFDRIQIDQFAGREWLRDEVEAFLNIHDRGYLIIEAKAGLGKTAFLAWLVKEKNFIHHFVESAPGQEGINQGLKNLAAQLILTYKLSPDELIPDAASKPDYIYELLGKAAKNRDVNEKIVLVVDALDEAGTPPNKNVLGLPDVLPEGVFFIVSQRPVYVTLNIAASIPCQTLRIDADSNENLKDMHSFLEGAATWSGVARALRDGGYTSEQFIEKLMMKSQGIWIYLYFVIHEIVRGERSPLNLEALPEGLTQYYIDYWSRWRDGKEDNWYEFYLPMLSSLATAQEAIPFERLIEWAEVSTTSMPKKDQLQTILDEKWSPFLIVSDESKGERYRFYHATVRDFFLGKVEHENLSSAQKAFVTGLARATRERHKKIAERYLTAWGSLERGLPKLGILEEIDEGYGLRYLTAHLEASGQVAKLHRLLALETGRGHNLWYETKDAKNDVFGYISDVMRAWHNAEDSYHTENVVLDRQNIGLQIRYALILASINSLSRNIPPNLLLSLMENGIWSPAKGLAYTRQVPDLAKRSKILTLLYPFFIKNGMNSALKEALDAARKIQNVSTRAKTFFQIASSLSEPQKTKVLNEALEIARDISDVSIRSLVISQIAPLLSEPQKTEVLNEILEIAGDISDVGIRMRALLRVAPLLSEPQKTEVLNEALEIARDISDVSIRSLVISQIAPLLSEPQKTEVLNEILEIAGDISDVGIRMRALLRVAPLLSEPQKTEVLNETLEIARDISDVGIRMKALFRVAPLLSEPQKTEVLNETLEIARDISDVGIRMKALFRIAPLSSEPQKTEVLNETLEIAREISNKSTRTKALSKVALLFPEPQKTEVLNEALEVAGNISDDEPRSCVISQIAPLLPNPQRALEVAREIPHRIHRANALLGIAPNLPKPEKIEMLQEVLDIAREIQDAAALALALSRTALLLPEPQRTEVLNKVLNEATKIENMASRANVLVQIAPLLSNPQRALEVAREIPTRMHRANALSGIAPNLPEHQKAVVLQEAIFVAKKIYDLQHRSWVLSQIAPFIPDPHDGLEVARYIPIEWYRLRAISQITPKLPGPEKTEELRNLLKSARQIRNKRARAKALYQIAPLLHIPWKNWVLEEALGAAREIQDKDTRENAFYRITLLLSKPQRALEIAREISNKDVHANALSQIASLLSEPQKTEVLNEALEIAREISNKGVHANALSQIASLLSEPQKTEVLNEALKVARDIPDIGIRINALYQIALFISNPQKALEIAREISNKGTRAKALSQIASLLSESQKTEVLNEAFEVARELQEEELREKILSEIVPLLLKQDSSIYNSLWLPTLRLISYRARKSLLSDLSSLIPLVFKLGGYNAMIETSNAIQDVGKWWP